jgi:hypothetical protein
VAIDATGGEAGVVAAIALDAMTAAEADRKRRNTAIDPMLSCFTG